MTIKQLKTAVRAMGGSVKYSSEYREFRVRFGTATYFTQDKGDALGTARHMALETARAGMTAGHEVTA